MYHRGMAEDAHQPRRHRRPWSHTVDEHRKDVHEGVLDAAAELVAERGLTGVTMAGIAERTAIGRATLYRHFPDVDAVLIAWHERQLAMHLEHLTGFVARATEPADQLRNLLTGYAQMSGRHGPAEGSIAAALHARPHAARTQDDVAGLVSGVLTACVEAGVVRRDVPVSELSTYCLRALTAVGPSSTGATVRRLVGVTLDALRPAAPAAG
jgi:AcrR family transcriptional regulator